MQLIKPPRRSLDHGAGHTAKRPHPTRLRALLPQASQNDQVIINSGLVPSESVNIKIASFAAWFLMGRIERGLD